MAAKNPRTTRQYARAVAELRARGIDQQCWSCGKWLSTFNAYPHPLCITLGHYTALEDNGDPYDPNNYGPQCLTCNCGDGARRTNSKRRGQDKYTPRKSWTNPHW